MGRRLRPSRRGDVAILGFHDGNAGQVETWFEEVTGFRIACFVHEAAEFPEINVEAENRKRISQRMDYPVTGVFKKRPFIVTLDWIHELKKRGIGKVLPLTTNNRDRFRQIVSCRENGIELVSAVHPQAVILRDARLEPGVWINAAAIIGYKAEVATGVLVNTGAQLDHHNVVRSCCQVDPGVVTAGHVTLDECCHIHTGAVIINRKRIGADAVIGAGAVVIDDIPPGCTAVGVPARAIRRTRKGISR